MNQADKRLIDYTSGDLKKLLEEVVDKRLEPKKVLEFPDEFPLYKAQVVKILGIHYGEEPPITNW